MDVQFPKGNATSGIAAFQKSSSQYGAAESPGQWESWNYLLKISSSLFIDKYFWLLCFFSSAAALDGLFIIYLPFIYVGIIFRKIKEVVPAKMFYDLSAVSSVEWADIES